MTKSSGKTSHVIRQRSTRKVSRSGKAAAFYKPSVTRAMKKRLPAESGGSKNTADDFRNCTGAAAGLTVPKNDAHKSLGFFSQSHYSSSQESRAPAVTKKNNKSSASKRFNGKQTGELTEIEHAASFQNKKTTSTTAYTKGAERTGNNHLTEMNNGPVYVHGRKCNLGFFDDPIDSSDEEPQADSKRKQVGNLLKVKKWHKDQQSLAVRKLQIDVCSNRLKVDDDQQYQNKKTSSSSGAEIRNNNVQRVVNNNQEDFDMSRQEDSAMRNSESKMAQLYRRNFSPQLSPLSSTSSAILDREAEDIIEKINDENMRMLTSSKLANGGSHVNQQDSSQVSKKKLPKKQIELYQTLSQKKVKKFTMYEDADLQWPIDSFLVRSEQQIIPKNGVRRSRITQEQDYDSDREIVVRAKAKLKRELKQAIEDHLAEKMLKNVV